MKTDYQKILDAVEAMEKSTYKRVIDVKSESHIMFASLLWLRTFIFIFNSGKLCYVQVNDRRSVCAKIEWSGELVGARSEGDKLCLYQNGNGYVCVNFNEGSIFAK